MSPSDPRSYICVLCKNYFRGKAPLQIKCLTQALATTPLTTLYEKTVGRPGLQMPVQYRTAFIKHVIGKVEKMQATMSLGSAVEKNCDRASPLNEEDDEEIPGLELWYAELEKLSSSPPEPFFRLYSIDNADSNGPIVQIFENENAFVSEGTTGLVTWEASIQSANWIQVKRPEELLQARWSIELGSGTGLLGITLVQAFPNISKIISTDGSHKALENCERNFKENSIAQEVIEFEHLDWAQDSSKFRSIVEKYTDEAGVGVLLGADIVFDASIIPALMNLINVFLDIQGGSGCCLLSCTVRNEQTLSVLLRKLRNRKCREAHKWNTEEEENGLVYVIR